MALQNGATPASTMQVSPSRQQPEADYPSDIEEVATETSFDLHPQKDRTKSATRFVLAPCKALVSKKQYWAADDISTLDEGLNSLAAKQAGIQKYVDISAN